MQIVRADFVDVCYHHFLSFMDFRLASNALLLVRR